MFSFLSVFGGLIFLVFGAEGLVRGSVALALRAGITPLLIGITLVAFGTSAPEFTTAIQASFTGNGALVSGNIIGSNLFNSLFIIGLCALVARTGHPLHMSRHNWQTHFPLLLIITVLATATLWVFNPLPRIAGAVALALLAAYTFWSYREEKAHPHALPEEITQSKSIPTWAAGTLMFFGLCGLLLGAKLFLDGTLTLAKTWGLSEGFTGLTLVSIGTAMPELITSLVATKRRQAALAIGNIVGSNIFNLLGILGAASLVKPLPVPPELKPLGLGILLAATAALALHTRVGGYKLTRTEGALFTTAYLLALFAIWKFAA